MVIRSGDLQSQSMNLLPKFTMKWIAERHYKIYRFRMQKTLPAMTMQTTDSTLCLAKNC